MDIQWLLTCETPQFPAGINIVYPSIIGLTNQYINSLFHAISIRDHETKGHTIRVTRMAVSFARYMGVPDHEIFNLQSGSILHDIGKLGVSDYILNKKGILTSEEMEEMKKHPYYAKKILSSMSVFANALDIPYFHHEKWDGSGYPEGLSGQKIPYNVRLFAVVDVWDALLSDRPYRKAWSRADAEEYLLLQSGKHFDPVFVEKFFNLMELKILSPEQ